MNNSIQTAITSFGMSGLVFHGPLLKVNKKFEVVRILERTKNVSREMFPNSEIVRSFDDILTNSAIELVVVNTPDQFHYEMVKQALLSGKHVVVEKPITQNSKQAEEIIRIANQKKLVFTVYQNRRWDGDFRTVQKVLKDNKLGRIIELESHYDRYRTTITPETWKEAKDDFGGVLFNLGSHMIDQVYVLFGKPLAVTAHLKIVRTGGKVIDYYDIRLEYNGFSAILKCSYLVKNPGPRYSIYGEFGTFHKWGIDPQEELLKAGKLPVGKNWGTEPESDWGTLHFENNGVDYIEKIKTIPGNYNVFYDNVYDSIRNGAELFVKPEEALDVLKIIESCVLSNQLKKTITL